MKPQSLDGCFMAMIAVPALCIVGITAMLTHFLYPQFGAWSLLIALPIALIVIVFSVAMQGHDAWDIIIGSLLALFFCAILLPVFARARENTERKMREAHTTQRSISARTPTQQP